MQKHIVDIYKLDVCCLSFGLVEQHVVCCVEMTLCTVFSIFSTKQYTWHILRECFITQYIVHKIRRHIILGAGWRLATSGSVSMPTNRTQFHYSTHIHWRNITILSIWSTKERAKQKQWNKCCINVKKWKQFGIEKTKWSKIKSDSSVLH